MAYCECKCGRELTGDQERWYSNSCKNSFNKQARLKGQELLRLSGSALRDRGIQQAEEHAEALIPGWQEEARKMFVKFLLQQGSVPFQAEYLRAYAHDRGLPKPPSLRAWGGVVRWAYNRKFIEFVRYEAVSNPRAHKTPAGVWKAA